MGVSSRHARPVPRAPLRWRRNRSAGVCESCALTIVGTVRDAWVVGRRGRWKTVCARVARQALLRGRSTSPLDDATRFAYATKATSAKSQGKDPSFETAGARAVRVQGAG